MIDEQLYQQATDELNSDRRRPHLWARACALASDDHDEARYLYTNLRVEELLAERDKPGSAAISVSSEENDSFYQELALEPIADDGPDAPMGLDLGALDDMTTGVPGAIASTRAGVTHGSEGALDLSAHLAAGAPVEDRPSSTRTEMSMDLNESASLDLDPSDLKFDTGEDAGATEEAGASAVDPLERLLAEEEMESSTAQAQSDLAAGTADDLVERGEPLSNVGGKLLGENPAVELDWLEGVDRSGQSLITDTDSLSDRDGEEDFAAPVTRDSAPITLAGAPYSDAEAGANAGAFAHASSETAPHIASSSSTMLAPSDDVGSGLRDDYADARDLDALLDEEDPSSAPAYDNIYFTEGRGALWAVYESHSGSLKAIKRGVSWGALFFTLPWLVCRGLIGTAVAYALLVILTLGGLILTGLAWMDAGDAAPDMLKLACVGFGVIAFIGLVIVPFFRANRWREQRYHRRGYAKLAKIRAPNADAALDRWTQRVV